MATSKQMLVVLVIAAAATCTILPSVAGATEFVVGDDRGWRLNFNYTVWAEGKTFRVGDKLVFKYETGKHNVHRVGGPEFLACKVPSHSIALTTGHDVITLAGEGRKWYICGVGKHCVKGMKLVITVHLASPAKAWKAPSAAASSPSYSYKRLPVNY